MKDKIIADFASSSEGDKRDGTERMICPVCRKIYSQREIENYDEEGTTRSIELCTTCREEFESDCDLEIDSDVLEIAAFGSLLKWAEETMENPTESVIEDPEHKAEVFARTIGGEAWQSGGGIWLVVKRTMDGRVVTFSDEVVVEYEDEAAFEEDNRKTTIPLTMR